MNQTITQSDQIRQWVVTAIISLGGLTVVGMAAKYWISVEVETQIGEISIPNVSNIKTDISTIKTDLDNIDENVNRALESQRRFEEIFTQYLIDQGANE